MHEQRMYLSFKLIVTCMLHLSICRQRDNLRNLIFLVIVPWDRNPFWRSEVVWRKVYHNTDQCHFPHMQHTTTESSHELTLLNHPWGPHLATTRGCPPKEPTLRGQLSTLDTQGTSAKVMRATHTSETTTKFVQETPNLHRLGHPLVQCLHASYDSSKFPGI